jgi:hypothetical protein
VADKENTKKRISASEADEIEDGACELEGVHALLQMTT